MPKGWNRLSLYGCSLCVGRKTRHEERANLPVFLIANESAYINGEVVTIDGGEWIAGAGEFNFLSRLTDEDWERLRPKKK